MTTNAYVYKITNILTGEFYIGYRCSNQRKNIRPTDDLWVKYFTSSNRVKDDIKKYGANSFTTEILFEHQDSIECWKREQILIKENWGSVGLLNGKYHDPESNVEVRRRVGLLSESSRTKMSIAGKGRPKSEEHKRKIAIANTGQVASDQKRKKISDAMKGRPAHNKGISPPKYTCPHCGKIASFANLQKWHNDNCKSIH